MTRFSVGDKVQSRVTAQGLESGHIYKVVDVSVQRTPAGDFVTYYVKDPVTQRAWRVGNGHLVLAEAP